jgi:hypothetical protein
LSFGWQQAAVVSAKDNDQPDKKSSATDRGDSKDAKSTKDKKAPANKKSRPESNKKAKKGSQETSDSSNTDSSNGGTGQSAGSGGLPAGGSSGSSTGGESSGTTAAGQQSAGKKDSAAGQAKGTAASGEESAKGLAPRPGVLDANHPDVKRVIDVQNRATPDLLKQKGIAGTSTGLDEDGNIVIKVYTTGGDSPKIPKSLEGIATLEVLTGPHHGYWQSAAFDPKARQDRPVPIGVSAVNENGACGNFIAAGTLGCRVKSSDGTLFALSNNHVFAAENAGIIGDPCVQPGSLDAFTAGIPICSPNDVFGTLFKFKPIDFLFANNATGLTTNVIDAAIVKTDASKVGNSTPPAPIAYGAPRTTTFKKPYLGLQVQKLGRTTGYTTGTITGLNQFVIVGYTVGIALFINQIEIVSIGNPNPFAAPGDSGSLIVTLEDRFPVALLFAGAGPFVDANPIQDVLDFFGVTIDGDDSAFIPPGKQGRGNGNSP